MSRKVLSGIIMILCLLMLVGCGVQTETVEEYTARVNTAFDKVLDEIQEALDNDLPLDEDAWDNWELDNNPGDLYDQLVEELKKAEDADKKYEQHEEEWKAKESVLDDVFNETAEKASEMVVNYAFEHIGDYLFRG